MNITDLKTFRYICLRVDPTNFNKILEVLRSLIERHSNRRTAMQEPISAGERLAVTLR